MRKSLLLLNLVAVDDQKVIRKILWKSKARCPFLKYLTSNINYALILKLSVRPIANSLIHPEDPVGVIRYSRNSLGVVLVNWGSVQGGDKCGKLFGVETTQAGGVSGFE